MYTGMVPHVLKSKKALERSQNAEFNVPLPSLSG